MDIAFEKQTFGKKLKSMLKVDIKRMFTTPLVYIMAGVCLIIPILILIMTSTMSGIAADPVTGEEKVVETFTNVWQSIAALSSAEMSMDITSMCNINMIYFLISVFVCIFVADDFRSGYVKNIFTVRSKRADYCISKSVAGIAGGMIMMLMFFIGAMIGGAIAGLSFDAGAAGAGGIAACLFSKLFVVGIFVGLALAVGVAAKQKLWLSIICSIGAGMLLYTMIPMITPLDSTFVNVIMCLGGGLLFAAGLAAVSNIILKKTSLV